MLASRFAVGEEARRRLLSVGPPLEHATPERIAGRVAGGGLVAFMAVRPGAGNDGGFVEALRQAAIDTDAEAFLLDAPLVGLAPFTVHVYQGGQLRRVLEPPYRRGWVFAVLVETAAPGVPYARVWGLR